MNKKISLIIVIAVFIVGFLLIKNGYGKSYTNTQKSQNQGADYLNNNEDQVRPITADDHILGNPNAEVFIVEYSDTECPFCKMFHTTMHQTIEKYDGKVAWVYRHYPIEQLHKKAFTEALATECAWEQGGNSTFWQFTDEVYTRTNSNDSLNGEELTNIATDLSLDLETFHSCILSQKYAEKIQNDILDGQQIGVRGTPTSVIVKNGKVVDKIPGAIDKASLEERLENIF